MDSFGMVGALLSVLSVFRKAIHQHQIAVLDQAKIRKKSSGAGCPVHAIQSNKAKRTSP
jgi:hypothetical protein